MFLKSLRLIDGFSPAFFTLIIFYIAQFINLGISTNLASLVLQLSTTTTKLNCPHRLLKVTARQGPAVGVTPVLIPE